MKTNVTWTRAWYHIKPCMMIMQVAPIVGKIRQVCHYGSLIIRDVTKKKKIERKVCTYDQGLVIAKGYLRTLKTF